MGSEDVSLLKENGQIDQKKLKQFLIDEYRYIQDVFASTQIPDRKEMDYNDVLLDEDNSTSKKKPNLQKDHTSRARSFQELHSRLDKFKGKKNLMFKERLEKKKIKNQLKKKTKRDERNAQKKIERAVKIPTKDVKVENVEQTETQETKLPVFNKDDKLVFSKIDFADLGKKKKVKSEKDPQKLLKKIEEQKETIKRLKESGDTEKAIEIREKSAWKNALAKAEGQKVKDDPQLLMKSVKKKEQKKRASKKKWDKRIEGVQKSKDEKQQKRTENIQKRKKDKKTNKLKKAAKKGKVIPGF